MTRIEKLYTVLPDLAQGDSSVVADHLAEDVRWCVAHPVNDLLGPGQVATEFLLPLINALPDLERKVFIHIPGEDNGQHWVNGCGYFVGTFSKPLFGIPPTGKTLCLRYTEMIRIENDRVAECYLIPDFLDAMIQANVGPIRAGLGHSGLIMPPSTMDGIIRDTAVADSAYSRSSVKLVMDMLDCLRGYDGKNLESMDLKTFWHQDFMWYGPAGIGTTRGIRGFREHHQGPFLEAFPDRDVDHHTNTIASGNYVATGGWPHMHGTHSGSGWLGMPATNRRLSMRVMDIWRREGNVLRENWVAIDLPDMLMQMGLDVFAQMKTITRTGDYYG